MHISSTTTSTKSTYEVPVLVLASSDAEGTVHTRKFVARPSRYHDLLITTRKLFGFENDATLVFGTSTLDVCRGTWIEIDESAYEPLLECLDEVTVRLGPPHEDVGEDQPVLTGKGKTREVDTSGDSTPLAKPPIDSLKPKGRQEPRIDALALDVRGNTSLASPASTRDDSKTRAETPTSTQSSSSPPRVKSKFTPHPEYVPNVESKPTKSRLLSQLDEMSKQKTSRSLVSNPRQRKLETEFEPERAADIEVKEEKPRPKFKPVVSATRQIKKEPEPDPVLRAEPPRARQRKLQPKAEPEPVKKRDEDEDHEPFDAGTEEVSDTGRKDSVGDEEDDDFWRFGTKSVGTRSGSSRTPAEESAPPPSNPKLTRTGTGIYVEMKKEPEEGKGKIRAARARLSTVNATHLPLASTRALGHFHQDPDMRFMVTVYGPRAGQGADFRTRGGHTIKKVLESACKTFELPFEQSRLVLEDDSRETLKQYYCDPDETVGSCGIDTESRLLVQVEGMTDEELGEYGEEEEEENED